MAGLLVGPVDAQVTLRVLDTEGSPIPAVDVTVYGLGELLGRHATSAQGMAKLSVDRWSDVRRITFSHLGFRTLIVQAAEIPADGLIRLEPQATRIEGFTVEGSDLCPVADDREARRLWSEEASRYSRATGSRAWLAYLSRYGGRVPEGEVHRMSESESAAFVAAGGGGVIHGGDHVPRSLDDRIANEGYAWPPLVIGGTTGRRELAWMYPELDRSQAHHFASPVFGSLHDFAVARESEGEVSLVFCENGEGVGATIQGVLSLVPGEGLSSAEWRFDTSHSEEGAGGAVWFTTYAEAPGSPPHLVATRGIFYRHSGVESPYPDLPRTYVREVTTQVRWSLLASAEHPCNTGLSYYGDPPTTPEGFRFADCVADHWRRD